MHRTFAVLAAATLFLCAAWPGAGQEKQAPAAILEKALTAAGGEAKLAKLQGVMLKGKGKSIEDGKEIPFSGIWYFQGADKCRVIIGLEAKGQRADVVKVVNGDKGWTKTAAMQSEIMTKDELAEEKENLYLNWIATLAPLKGKQFKLTALDEAKVDGRALAGFSIASPGHREIKFWFDKETWLLTKSERKLRDVATKKDSLEEMVFSNYKDVQGIKIAMKFTVKLDGKPNADGEMSEATVQEKLDEKLFTKP
jgi:hypothetical protein